MGREVKRPEYCPHFYVKLLKQKSADLIFMLFL